MKRSAFAALAIAAGIYGCATPETQDTASAPSAAPAPSPSPRSPAASTAGVQGGKTTAAAPAASPGPAASQRPDLKRSVYFEFDKHDVKPEYRPLVEEHARWLRANPKAKLVIEGNADERGSREYNVALGQRRAEAVMKMLVLMGARPEQLEAVSWGEEKPRATGHDEASWAQNRRDDFVAK